MQSWFSQLGPMQWPFLCLSVIALAVIIERLWVLSRAWLTVHEIKRKPHFFRSKAVGALRLQGYVFEWRKRLVILSIIGTLSPLMGLFGTVWGLVLMFKTIAETQQAVTPALLADGLWEAMYSTMAGLAIAMPCLLIYGVLQAMVERFQSELVLYMNTQFTLVETDNA
ncbi:MotA/TolQ/ExbB proton channel family protein [Pseudoalteromonas maricaloris]|uniref:MotA/TolQ/ExbB proton channel family protein n=1 Tax=Pseudoalteromonas maricaloris TaxID=184924 RepID=A0A8I2H6C6_9GAMM|nr:MULTISPECIES: MotA/TolQ/ExbB proton channel family protein [Pseudoalteromonas]KID33797.1 biopolymer transporter [Pseudoalteromonas flavipulchra NCIMB 2033 = ATCC BAA-314]MBD0782169.1 MotA/TolQ/ExbB proton channel family protein [Pseudoalteromonas flavipulchra]MBE0375888.1 biopolymer transport protein ExbB [Pseudoalteromonas flavipulchra NCIMB 2033 = ATCC BAA-314]NLR21001.1 MotA/TolQ/ExbB proton channel family protein [Pseudoalteromonas maricaloris]WOX30760.1 MotA/TolQ/ExbB proton channel fa